ncbi:unnamed protein product [Agarophyton chilense]
MRFQLKTQNNSSVEILLFRNATNTKGILSLVRDGEIPAAFLQARLIPDIFPVLVAVSKAVQDDKNSSMSTRNLFTEIIYNLSGSKNISKALKTFGIQEDTSDILVVVPHPQNETTEKIRHYIKAEEMSFNENCLEHIAEERAVKRIYGITEKELECGTLVDSVVTRMACRDLK